MTDISLYPHNEEAYKRLIENLKSHQMTSINHATGTGKSFIILKYLYENKGKRILYLAPTYPIINQLIEEHMKDLGISIDEFTKFDTQIYPNLLKTSVDEIADNYDIIIFDEYHRCGAREWGKRINRIVELVKERHPETKVIGTTATEVRYLDDNRDMNSFLFDDNACSTLSLADAILAGILPAPKYYCFDFDLLEKVSSAILRVERYCDDPYKKAELISELMEIRDKITKDYQSNIENNSMIKGKKFLSFAPTIFEIENNRKKVSDDIYKLTVRKKTKDILGKDIEEYVVHSRKKREENEKEIDKFVHGDGRSVLYSVSILNEGLHVKDVDGALFFRQTTSPIIFFQQLGRILSFSKEKRTPFVLDLVGNIRRHPAIYNVFNDIIARAKELIETDPENRERYENIIKNLEIVDTTLNESVKFDEIAPYTSRINLNIENVARYISMMLRSEKDCFDYIFARNELRRLYKYITLEDFKRIKKYRLDITGGIFDLNEFEFEAILDGSQCLSAKTNHNYGNAYKAIMCFVNDYGRLPSIYIEEERELANQLFRNFVNFNDEQQESIINTDHDNYSPLELISIGLNDEDILQSQVIKEIVSLRGQSIFFNSNVSLYVVNSNIKDKSDIISFIKESNQDYVGKNKSIIDGKLESETVKSIDSSQIMNYGEFKECFYICKKKVEHIGVEEFVKELFEELKKYYETYKNELRYKVISPKDTNKEELHSINELYYKKILFINELREFGYLELLTGIESQMIVERALSNKESYINKMIEFIKTHDGVLPSEDSTIKEEKTLARMYRLNTLGLTPEQIELIKSNLNNNILDKVVYDYVLFIKTTGRRPVPYAIDEEEIKLLEDYDRISSSLDEKQKRMVKEAVASINKLNEIELKAQILAESKKRGATRK